ncbi:hypothetical protein JCM1840_005579 [Sporobolomyces johnsonii]
MATQLGDQMDRMNLNSSPARLDTHAVGGLAVPAQGVRKQRSQRFTVPLSPPRAQSSSPSPSSYSIPPSTLAFQPAPLPVQAQSIGLAPETYYQTSSGDRIHGGGGGGAREYSSSVSSSEEDQPQQQRTQYSHPSPLSYSFQQPAQPPQYHSYRPHPLPSPTPSPAPGSAPLSYGGLPGSPPMEFTYHHQGMTFLATPGAPGGFAQSAPQGFARGFGATGGGYGARQGQGMAMMQGDDEVIDTAIVIKSIPFSAPKEQLLAVMDSLSLPPPFAFNYHYDTSAASPAQAPQFRGLAFANYRTPEEARLTVSALNGFEFQGRKLRAEFKRVLKPGEKEAIEREKALKRMRSAQLLANEYLGPAVGAAAGAAAGVGGWNRREASAPGGYPIGVPGPFGGVGMGLGPGAGAGEEEDYGRPILGGAFSRTFGAGAREYGSVGGGEVEAMGMGMGRQASLSTSGSEGGSESLSGSGASERLSAGGERKNELDLNDPPTLEIYSRVLLFRDDSLRDELAFARSLTAGQRRIVHLVAKKLGMDHRSEGDEREGGRQVVVYKRGKAPGGDERKPHTLRQHASASHLRRPASRDSFTHPYYASHSLSPSRARTPPPPALPTSYSAHYLSPTSLHPSPSALRGKKSMPDIRYSTSGHLIPSSSSSSSLSSSALAAPGRVTMTPGRRANGTYATIANPPGGRAREVPSVLGLFQQHGIADSSASAAGAAHSRSASGSGSGGKDEGIVGRREFYASGTNEVEGGSGRAEAVRMPEGPGSAAAAGMEWRKR